MKTTKHLFELDGKVALITGSSKGIGLALAEVLAEYGAKVVVSSRSQDSVDEVAKNLREKGHTVMAQACHVGDSEQRKILVNKTIETYGGIDILINNAAINPVFKGLESMSEEIYDKMMNVNLKAAFDLSNLCFPYLKDSKGSSIINIASVEGLKPSFGLGLYGVTKAALIMLTQVQAKEWGKYGIRSNAICPGLIQTKFSSALWQNETIMKQVVKELAQYRYSCVVRIRICIQTTPRTRTGNIGGLYGQ